MLLSASWRLQWLAFFLFDGHRNRHTSWAIINGGITRTHDIWCAKFLSNMEDDLQLEFGRISRQQLICSLKKIAIERDNKHVLTYNTGAQKSLVDLPQVEHKNSKDNCVRGLSIHAYVICLSLPASFSKSIQIYRMRFEVAAQRLCVSLYRVVCVHCLHKEKRLKPVNPTSPAVGKAVPAVARGCRPRPPDRCRWPPLTAGERRFWCGDMGLTAQRRSPYTDSGRGPRGAS